MDFTKYLQNFQQFYNQLENKSNIFYMYFTKGLLHWVDQCLDFIPEDVNLVLIGADLSEEEIKWVRGRTLSPFHTFPRYFDDKTIWEFLFQTNQQHFGWIDIDCFVLNKNLFQEMTVFEKDVAVNCVWSYYDDYHPVESYKTKLDILKTYFLFINIDVVKALQKRGITVSPCTYNEEVSSLGRHPDFTSCIITEELKDMLRTILPQKEDGSLVYPLIMRGSEERRFIDTLVMYQLIAQYCGYRLNKVRPFKIGTTLDQYFSDEAVHIGGSSWYKTYMDPNAGFSELSVYYEDILSIDFIIMVRSVERLPSVYGIKKRIMQAELNNRGISLNQARERVVKLLIKSGLQEASVNRLVQDRESRAWL
nr:hypothetical protein [Paenibacillus xylanexedens]